jgi:hypothetical protein
MEERASSLHIVPWVDPLVDGRGVLVRSAYVEQFWLPVLGPSATFLLRRLGTIAAQFPDGVTLDREWLGSSLGLGKGESRNAPLPRAIERCIRFGVAKRVSHDRLAVRRAVGLLPQRYVERLHPLMKELHRDWLARSPQSVVAFESV